MIETNLTKKALNLIQEKQTNQVDKSGSPYINHLLFVANKMDDEITTTVALLHDLLEDTSTTVEDIKDFPNKVIDAVILLTRKKEEDYFEYIKRVGENPIARKVKIADLEHNMDLSRLKVITDKDIERNNKYKESYNYLIEKEKRNLN